MNERNQTVEDNRSIPPDQEMVAIADYVCDAAIDSTLAYETARYCLLDSLGCALLALQYPACTKMLGPVVKGTTVPIGVRVPGTAFELDPLKAAFDIGCCIRWLDYNDTWLAAEWGHPSDNLGAILSAADFVSRRARENGDRPLTMHDVFTAMIKAHEIQGVMALENSFNRIGLDHVVLVKLASAAVSAFLLGGSRDQIIDVVSHVWVDGQSLRTYRHAPNAGPRKSWAAGDATARGLQLALTVLKGEPGYPGALTTPTWGFYDATFGGKRFKFSQGYGSYVMENILFKISFPAEFHAQTAVEAAVRLHPDVKNRLEDIERIELTTHESAIRIISKTGPLRNPADRDHCLQYMVAIGLIHGTLTADHYEDESAADPRIDAMREKMTVKEDERYSRDYLDPEKRSIANAVQIFFADGTKSDKVEIEYPIGHRRRRKDGIPLLKDKALDNFAGLFGDEPAREIIDLFDAPSTIDALAVDEFMQRLARR